MNACPVPEFPPPAAGVPARESQLLGVCATHPVTADPCLTTGLLLPRLPIVAANLCNPHLQKVICG